MCKVAVVTYLRVLFDPSIGREGLRRTTNWFNDDDQFLAGNRIMFFTNVSQTGHYYPLPTSLVSRLISIYMKVNKYVRFLCTCVL